jgi:hypothetical protein
MSPERPRDALGRPLPAGADPALAVPGVPVRDSISDDEAWIEGLAYLDRGMPFHAHEVFEMRWRSAPADHRDAWRALAQWGAALTHEARGNPTGAHAVAERALVLLDGARVPPVVDVVMVRRSLMALTGAGD